MINHTLHVIDSNSSEDNKVVTRPMPILWGSNLLFLQTEFVKVFNGVNNNSLLNFEHFPHDSPI